MKARRVGADDVLTEPFYAYPYAFPDMTVTIDGQPVRDYGDQANFLAGTSEKSLSYGGFYGGDEGEVIFSTGIIRPTRSSMFQRSSSYTTKSCSSSV